MKSVLAVALLLATALALTEASPSHAVQKWSCDLKGLENDLRQLGTTTQAAAEEVGQDIAKAAQGLPACLKLSAAKIWPCVEQTVGSQCTAATNTLNAWAGQQSSLWSDIGSKLQQCLKI